MVDSLGDGVCTCYLVWGTNLTIGLSTVCYTGIAIEISYQISMFVDPMEEMIFEMLLHLLICFPPGALHPDLIKGPFQPCGEGGNLLVVTLGNFIKLLH